MDILVVGAGAMGSLYGGRLRESGYNVVLVDIWSQHIEAINANGLKIEGETGVQVISIPARFAHEVQEKADLLIVFTKTFHTEKALESVLHVLHDNTVTMTLQNGLGNIELLEKYFPRERIIVGTTNFPSDLVGPGYVRSLGAGETVIMQLDNCGINRVEAVNKILNDAGFNCKVTDNIYPFIWEKVAFNAAMNSLTAVTGLTVGQLGLSADGRNLAFQVADEVLNVAKSKGIVVNKEKVKEMMDEAFIKHFDHQPSMLQDLKAGKMTEIESINGAVVREAKKIGCAVPATEVLYKLVRVLEQSRENHTTRYISG
jgi:2-dehydropantoate 2-reductase